MRRVRASAIKADCVLASLFTALLTAYVRIERAASRRVALQLTNSRAEYLGSRDGFFGYRTPVTVSGIAASERCQLGRFRSKSLIAGLRSSCLRARFHRRADAKVRRALRFCTLRRAARHHRRSNASTCRLCDLPHTIL